MWQNPGQFDKRGNLQVPDLFSNKTYFLLNPRGINKRAED